MMMTAMNGNPARMLRRRWFGYRWLFISLRDQGEPSGVNRIYRLYREEGLTVRKRKARRRPVRTRTPTPRDNGLLYGLVTAFMALFVGWVGSVVFRRD
jgi:hypothetical protein